MRAENASPVLSPTRATHVDCAQSALVSLRPIPPLRSVASASERIGNLVRRAMTFFDTNREAAWCCLRDASMLLGSETEESDINAPALQCVFRTGGLAVWQAKRTVAYIEANLGSKLAIREMADLVALSKSHFARAFKQTLGSSPMACRSAESRARQTHDGIHGAAAHGCCIGLRIRRSVASEQILSPHRRREPGSLASHVPIRNSDLWARLRGGVNRAGPRRCPRVTFSRSIQETVASYKGRRTGQAYPHKGRKLDRLA